MNDEKAQLERKLLLLNRNEEIKTNIKIFKKAKRWAEAKDGKEIGHGSYYVHLKNLTLGSAFMGFGTGGSASMDFPSQTTGSIYGKQTILGKMNITPQIADAFIALLESELT